MAKTVEERARDALNEVAMERGSGDWGSSRSSEAVETVCRLIEQQDAFAREVSDAWVAALSCLDQLEFDDRGEAAARGIRLVMSRFILPDPVDLVDLVAGDISVGPSLGIMLREALAKRGLSIVPTVDGEGAK